MKAENYITIQGWMITDMKLKSNQLLAYAIIYGFCQDGESEYLGSTRYLCDTLGISRPTATKILNDLLDKGLIDKKQQEINGVLFNRFKTLQGGKKLTRGRKETLQGGRKETLHSITNNRNTKGKEKDIDKSIYKKFGHLKISHEEYETLKKGYGEERVNDILESIENYKKNTNYKSLYLTAKKWLKREHGEPKEEAYTWTIGKDPAKHVGTKTEYETAKKQYEEMGMEVKLTKNRKHGN